MSGFEIAGVVLGSVPIIVQACQFYVKLIEDSHILRRRYYIRELRSRVRTLNVEYVRLQNVCEKLLLGLVPTSQIEILIADPLGDAWRDASVQQSINARLLRGGSAFSETLEDMLDAITTLKKKMGIDPDAKVRLLPLPIISEAGRFLILVPTQTFQPPQLDSPIQRLLARIAFIFRKDEFKEILDQVRYGVSSLESLVNLNMELDQARQAQHFSKVCLALQSTSSSIHTALAAGFQRCPCPGRHQVGLQLHSNPLVFKNLCWRSRMRSSSDIRTRLLHSTIAVSLEFQSYGEGRRSPEDVRLWKTLSLRPSYGEPLASSASPSSDAADSANTITAPRPPITPPNARIEDLCRVLRTALARENGGYYGILVVPDSDNKPASMVSVFSADNVGPGRTDWCLVSLRDVLTEEMLARPLLHHDKVRLAWAITLAAIQLHDTPWLPGVLTLDDIFLAKEAGAISYHQVFVANKLPSGESLQCFEMTDMLNRARMLALGGVLIELMTEQTLPAQYFNLLSKDPQDMWAYAGAFQKATELLDRVNTLGGFYYYSAVNRCVRNTLWGSQPLHDQLLLVLDMLQQENLPM
jgi:hypothetical protein